jgi:hypothetical protein
MFTVGMRLTGPPRFIHRLCIKMLMAQPAAAELRFFLHEMLFRDRVLVFTHGFGALDGYT